MQLFMSIVRNLMHLNMLGTTRSLETPNSNSRILVPFLWCSQRLFISIPEILFSNTIGDVLTSQSCVFTYFHVFQNDVIQRDLCNVCIYPLRQKKNLHENRKANNLWSMNITRIFLLSPMYCMCARSCHQCCLSPYK